MKWIGQHIYDLVSRFRDDVYLEDISTGTIASGAHLGLDSNNKIVKATDGGGDLTAIAVGVGLEGEDLSGPIPTLSVSGTLAGLRSFGSAGFTTDILAGDLTMYNAVNDGNPTLSIGSSATNRFEISVPYNSGTQTLCDVDFKTYTASGTTNDGRFSFYVDEVLLAGINDSGMAVYGNVHAQDDDVQMIAYDTATSSATQGGKLKLMSDDGAAIEVGHRLGVIEFQGAEDASNTRSIGARIEALTASLWSGSENKANLLFYTTDGTTESEVLKLDSNKLATFTGSQVIDTDRTGGQGAAGAEDVTALHVDFDRARPDSGTYVHNDRGIDLDVTSQSLGTSSLYGMDIDVVGNTTGTSIAYGIHLDVDSADTNIGIQINTAGTHLKLVANADTDDYATMSVADTGDLTIATVGDGTTDSDLILDADGEINLNTATGFCRFTSTATSAATVGAKLNLVSNDGAALGDDHLLGRIAFVAAEDGSSTLRTGAKIEAFADAAWSASENGTRLEFYTMDGDNTSELSLTLDSDLLATFAGAVTVTGALTGTLATVSQPNITGVGTIGTGVWNGTKITDIYTNASGRRYGSTIKILPSDFMINDDAASPLSFKDGSNSGVHVNDAANEAIAFVTIPEGMKATHVDVYASHNKTLTVDELDVNASYNFTGTARGTGACNTQLDITDTNATATNFLAITVTLTATTHRVYGGLVTIAPQ